MATLNEARQIIQGLGENATTSPLINRYQLISSGHQARMMRIETLSRTAPQQSPMCPPKATDEITYDQSNRKVKFNLTQNIVTFFS